LQKSFLKAWPMLLLIWTVNPHPSVSPPLNPPRRFGIPIDTLRKWEQGKRQPDAVGRSYLRLIAKNPQFVEDSVRANVPGE
jgi:hypothetical protein